MATNALRAQSSIEFLVALSVLFILFLALFQIYVQKQGDYDYERQTLVAIKAAEKVGREINAALASGNGTSTQVQLRNESGALGNYTICALGHVVEVRWKNNSRTASATTLANSTFTQNASSIALCTPANSTQITIRNVNGEIYID